MAKYVSFNQIGGPEVLNLTEGAIPNPQPNEVIVQVKACGLNRAEYMFMHGNYLIQPNFPSKIGMEAAGIITTIGNQVNEYKVGDAVCLLPNVDITQYGYLGEYVAVPEAHLIKKPQALNFLQAAGFWTASGTAYGLLVQAGKIDQQVNPTVLITAASSSVGVASIQMAKYYNAKVIASTRTQAKVSFLKAQGADAVIVLEEESIENGIQRITDGKGFSLAIDPITGPIVASFANAAAPEAKIILYGRLNDLPTPFPLSPLLGKGLQISGFHLGFHLLNHRHRRDRMESTLLQQLDEKVYPILIDRTFDLNDIQSAYQYLASNQQKGKILVRVS